MAARRGGAVFLAVALGGTSGARGAPADTAELVGLAEMVGFLRARIRRQNPALIDDPQARGARLDAALADLGFALPRGEAFDPRLDDLALAGLLFEEQLRRRRGPAPDPARPPSASVSAVAPGAARATGRPMAAAVPAASTAREAGGGSSVAAVGAMFRDLRRDRPAARPAPHPEGGRAPRLPPPGPRAARVAAVARQLRGTLAAVSAPASDAPPPVSAGPPRSPDPLAPVLGRVAELVRGQEADPARFPAVMRGALETFGLPAPAGFRPGPSDAPATLATALRQAAPGALDLTFARAALGL